MPQSLFYDFHWLGMKWRSGLYQGGQGGCSSLPPLQKVNAFWVAQRSDCDLNLPPPQVLPPLYHHCIWLRHDVRSPRPGNMEEAQYLYFKISVFCILVVLWIGAGKQALPWWESCKVPALLSVIALKAVRCCAGWCVAFLFGALPLWCVCANVFVLLWVEIEIETPWCGLWHEYQICAWCLAMCWSHC